MAAPASVARHRSHSPSGSVEVNSPAPVPASSFCCEARCPCRECRRFQAMKVATEQEGATARRARYIRSRSGSSSSGSEPAEHSIGGQGTPARRGSCLRGGEEAPTGGDDSDDSSGDSSSAPSSPITEHST
ncbi:unnamed protein product [Urochloa humidicola]